MSDILAIQAITLPALSEQERSSRSAALRAMPLGALEGKVSAQINAGALLVFDNTLSGQNISDVSNSVLFSQLAADYQFNRFNESQEWRNKFLSVLSQVAWSTQSSTVSNPTILPPPVDWEKNITEHMSESAKSLTATGIGAAKALPKDSDAIRIWDGKTLSGTEGTMLIGVVQRISGDITLSLAVTSFAVIVATRDFLQFSPEYGIKSCWASLELNEDVYAEIRESIIKKLGDRAELYIVDFPA